MSDLGAGSGTETCWRGCDQYCRSVGFTDRIEEMPGPAKMGDIEPEGS